MDITPFIRELLFSHDCVIVPGFGGFIGNYAPARIDRGTSTFYPPLKKISFNRNLNSNDGLLAGRISENTGISFSEALKMIEEYVLTLKQKIGAGEKIIFDNIGSFITNDEGSIQFEPERNINYYPGSFGLESFQFPPVEDYDVRKRITRHIDKEEDHWHSTRVFLWRAAVIIPLVALATIVTLKTRPLKPGLETTTLNPIVTNDTQGDKRAGYESIIPPVPLTTVEVVPEQSEGTVIPDSGLTPGITDAGGGYFLITGSFRLRENADQHADILRQKGFTPEIIISANGFFRVSSMRCNDLSGAIGKKDSLIKQFPGTWVRKI